MSNKVRYFYGFCLFILISFTFYQKQFLKNLLNEMNSIANSPLIIDSMCTTQWYRQYQLEFDVFSTENFTQVIFLMDHSYSNTISDGLYKCFFFKYGTTKRLKGELLNRIGGMLVTDPHHHTFCLQCSIPNEAIHKNAMKIYFLLGKDDNLTNGINISICRSYDSSYHFVNRRIYIENERKSDIKKLTKRRELNRIGSCTQTSGHDKEFSFWIDYHYQMGIEHFYIYDHSISNETSLHRTLKYYIDLDILTIIPWYVDQWNDFNYHSSVSNWITHQIWSQNDCIRRYGYLYSWILISDVDEFILPMGKYQNFSHILQFIPPNYSALQILHYSFRGLPNETSILSEDRPKKYVHRNREHQYPNVQSKNFVRPKLVHYYSVHQVTRSMIGTAVFYANIETHARLHHYQRYFIKNEELNNYIIDKRFLSLLNKFNNSLSTNIISNKTN